METTERIVEAHVRLAIDGGTKVSDFGEITASEKLFGQRPDGECFAITIEIGRPYKWGGSSPTEWACAVKVDPFFSRQDGTHGEGALQALCLALHLVHMELANFTNQGGVISFDGSSEIFSLDAYWPDNWMS